MTDYKMIQRTFKHGDRFEWGEYAAPVGKYTERLLRVVQYFGDGNFDVLTGTEAQLVAHLEPRYGQEGAKAIVAAMNDDPDPDPKGSPEVLKLTGKPLHSSAHEIAREVEKEAEEELREMMEEMAKRGKVFAAEVLMRALIDARK